MADDHHSAQFEVEALPDPRTIPAQLLPRTGIHVGGLESETYFLADWETASELNLIGKSCYLMYLGKERDGCRDHEEPTYRNQRRQREEEVGCWSG